MLQTLGFLIFWRVEALFLVNYFSIAYLSHRLSVYYYSKENRGQWEGHRIKIIFINLEQNCQRKPIWLNFMLENGTQLEKQQNKSWKSSDHFKQTDKWLWFSAYG